MSVVKTTHENKADAYKALQDAEREINAILKKYAVNITGDHTPVYVTTYYRENAIPTYMEKEL